MSLQGKRLLLGMSGGIAAYKCCELIRRVRDLGAEVRVVMTEGAQAFMTPLTLQALSGQPVHLDLLDPSAEAAMGHIELAKWADLILVAPASANTLARMAHGLADDLLGTLLLATPAPVAVAPAMNQQMWAHPATQANLALLQQRGVMIWGPASGSQACGDVGPGRMLEAAELVTAIAQHWQPAERPLQGISAVITAGPTRESIDPVRYISNHSSGKMGFAIAEALAKAGADVTLIAGPCQLATPSGVTRVDIQSAQQMLEASLQRLTACDLFVASAAVADYRLAEQATQKMKKQPGQEGLTLTLVENPDIVATVAQHPRRPRLVVGFAAETQHLIDYAQRKLTRKKLDLVIANDVSNPEIGFNSDQNAVTLVDAHGNWPWPQMSKAALADALVQEFAKRLLR